MFWFFTANPKKRKQRLLQDAENLLIDSELQLETAKANCSVLRTRIARLRAELCQPAPTALVENVTFGDITPQLTSDLGNATIATLKTSARRNR